jgi:uncharacterized membrane protein YgdD (TMEM256/DUF423 family)
VKPSTWIACGALLAGLSVAAGAFGAHWLTGKLRDNPSVSENEAERRLQVYESAARYQMYHALAVVIVGLMASRSSSPCLTASGWLFVAGIAIFCGCLYALGLGAPRTLGRVVPFGGASFIAGWVCLTVAAVRSG